MSSPISEDAKIVAASMFFDADWYRSTYPDVAARHLDLPAHYLSSGAAEGRDPGSGFSTSDYLTRYPDVAGAGMNPLCTTCATAGTRGAKSCRRRTMCSSCAVARRETAENSRLRTILGTATNLTATQAVG
jgi:hypothetical protein